MNQLVWIDLETGGLNGPLLCGSLGMQFYPIFEIAVIITDTDLNELGEPLRLVIKQEEKQIAKSHNWAIEQHTKTGLLKEVRESAITIQTADQLIIDHLQAHGIDTYNRKTKEGGIMAGNSIHFDRDFIQCQLPKLDAYLHYRQIDISALALAFRFWNQEKANEVSKEYGHVALGDIRESIAEARIYKQAIQRSQDQIQED